MALFDLFSESTPTVYGSNRGAGGYNWGSIVKDPLAWISGLGTALGGYSVVDNMLTGRKYADEARRRAASFDRAIQQFYADNAAYRAKQMEMVGGMMSGAMRAMMAPPPGFSSTYAPMSDAAAAARRRGITAQQALRTGGNEGALVDQLVGSGMAEDELERFKASTQLDAILHQGQMSAFNQRLSMWPALLSAAVAALGGGPPPPVRPMDVTIPTGPNIGSLGAIGDYFKYRKQQDALDAERRANQDWRNRMAKAFDPGYSPGMSNVPDTYSPEDYR